MIARPGPLIACVMFALVLTLVPATSQAQEKDLVFFVVVKSSNYAQARDGSLSLLNYHFFSEIFLKDGGRVTSATIKRKDAVGEPLKYVDRGDSFYVEGGHFDSLKEVDIAYPNGKYVFNIDTPSGAIQDLALDLTGPGGSSEIPAPITITLHQDGKQIDPLRIDPSKDLVVRWGDYDVGNADPNGIIDDLIFFVVATCHGKRIVHSGLPFEGPYLTYRATEYRVPAGTLRPGEPHSMFVEFPNQVDTVVVDGVPGFATYATASYLDTQTLGKASGPACPAKPPPMDTGQTDRGNSPRK